MDIIISRSHASLETISSVFQTVMRMTSSFEENITHSAVLVGTTWVIEDPVSSRDRRLAEPNMVLSVEFRLTNFNLCDFDATISVAGTPILIVVSPIIIGSFGTIEWAEVTYKDDDGFESLMRELRQVATTGKDSKGKSYLRNVRRK